MESGGEPLRRPRTDLRHPGDGADRHGGGGAGELRHRLLPHRSRPALAARSGRHGDRAARGHPFDHLRHVGPVRAGAGDDRARHALAQRPPRDGTGHRPAVPGPTAGHRPAYRRPRAGDHGDPVHLLGDARSVPDRADPVEGIGLRAGLDPLGSELGHRPAVHAFGGDRRHLPRPGPCPGRNHGRGLRGRQRGAAVAFAAGARHDHRRAGRQPLRRGHRDLPLGPAAPGLRPVHRDLRGARHRTPDAVPAGPQGGQLMSTVATPAGALYLRRRITNAIALVLSCATALFGLFFLGWILWTLLARGLAGIDWNLFTRMTPPPMQEGGLANAFFGSAVMCLMAIAIGTPLGVAAGTWLAEYGRARRAGTIVRFVNDILLSAPSIVLGLFVYTLYVMPAGGNFSALAGAIALAFIVLPVVVRTTDEMLRLVPVQMREAALSLGIPQWKVTVQVLYRSASAGIVTGVLLALARISGE